MAEHSIPADRRKVWLTIALAVAKNGLPEPAKIECATSYDGRPVARLGFDSHAAARRWAEHLRCLPRERWQDHLQLAEPKRSVYYHTDPDALTGWRWTIEGEQPLVVEMHSELAAQVVAAIKSDAEPAVA